MSRATQIAIITCMLAEQIELDGRNEAELADINRDGWGFREHLDAEGRRWIQHTGVVLTPSELTLAIQDAQRLVAGAAENLGGATIMTLRYHVELADDPGGEQAAALARAMDGSVLSTVRRYNGVSDLALIDINSDDRESFNALLDFEASENGTVVAWRISVPA